MRTGSDVTGVFIPPEGLLFFDRNQKLQVVCLRYFRRTVGHVVLEANYKVIFHPISILKSNKHQYKWQNYYHMLNDHRDSCNVQVACMKERPGGIKRFHCRITVWLGRLSGLADTHRLASVIDVTVWILGLIMYPGETQTHTHIHKALCVVYLQHLVERERWH